jgi:peptidoglycan/LPS O-acetylase OafA/YrhL
MAAAVVAFQPVGKGAALRERLPWSRYLAVYSVIIVLFLGVQRASFQHNAFLRPLQLDLNGLNWLADLAVALWAALLLITFCKHRAENPTGTSDRRSPWLLRIFEHPAAVALGTFSYSMYLFHAVFLNLVDAFVRSVAPTGTAFLISYAAVAMPVAMAGSYVFYLLVERHCLNTPKTPCVQKETPPPVVIPVGGIGAKSDNLSHG